MARTPHCSTACTAQKWVVALLLLLMSVASALGVYMTHVVGSQMQFGNTDGSLAIIAFVVSVMAWSKQMVCCMGKHCPVCNPEK